MVAPPRGYYGAMAAAVLMAVGGAGSGAFPRTVRKPQQVAKPSSNRKAQLLEKARRRQARAS